MRLCQVESPLQEKMVWIVCKADMAHTFEFVLHFVRYDTVTVSPNQIIIVIISINLHYVFLNLFAAGPFVVLSLLGRPSASGPADLSPPSSTDTTASLNITSSPNVCFVVLIFICLKIFYTRYGGKIQLLLERLPDSNVSSPNPSWLMSGRTSGHQNLCFNIPRDRQLPKAKR